ncbi:MAG: HIT domain-containing protein [Actinobacteria bacterium]|nr:MAG: HIT domain-containing protein [Actinomycetota bacterium]
MAALACARCRPSSAGGAGAPRSVAPTSCWSTGRAAATATITRPGSSRHRWGASSAHARPASPTKGCSQLQPDCLFCRLYREGDHVHAADGFVAIRDIAPKAQTHLLVIPERHVATFRDVAEFPPDEAKRMLEFVAETALRAGLEDYRVIVNVGPGGGQTIFHLHWHVLGGASLPGFA